MTSGLEDPSSIALDLIHGKMYWTDGGTGKIQRGDLDGSNVEDVVVGVDRPWGIALDLGCGGLDCQPSSIGDACEVDSDADGTIDDCDGCPGDPEKTSPGVCGCGVTDADSDSDTVPDCIDQCPGQDDTIDINNNGVTDCVDPDFVPTLSAWNLAVLALSLAVAAKLCYRRRLAG